jgi:hypothetical protein
MSLLQFYMLPYEFLKLQQEILIIILIISIIIIIVIVGTQCGAIIFFSQVNSYSVKTRNSNLGKWTIQFSQIGRLYLFFLNT